MKRHWLLVKNELIKIFNRPKAIIAIFVIILLLISSAIIQKKDYSSSNKEWRTNIEQQIRSDEKELKDLDANAPDSYYKTLKQDIKLNQYLLEKDQSPNKQNVWKFIYSNLSILIIVMLFSILTASDLVSLEYSNASIKLLLIRPYKRWKFLLSKYIAINMFSIILIAIYLLVSFLLGLLLFGGISEYNIQNIEISGSGEIIARNVLSYSFISVFLQLIQLIIFITFSFMISTILRNSIVATFTSILIFFGGSVIANLTEKIPLLEYTLFAHLNLTRFLNEGKSLLETSLINSLIILLIYWILMLLITFVTFGRRDVKT
ncbi:ABC transporter permease [Priestia endophytica]|uniref:ABC transporter permease n=1 Tax=Priestia endophytica TaxID=135735 RepID=UPI00124C26FB|nr:ABC transporter permease subunit [Priestia endophytica]KAB2488214.1 ABC transporter permease subunit [Priestia endophytica]